MIRRRAISYRLAIAGRFEAQELAVTAAVCCPAGVMFSLLLPRLSLLPCYQIRVWCGAGGCSAFHGVAGVAYRRLGRVEISGRDEVRDAAAHVDGPLGVVQNLVMRKTNQHHVFQFGFSTEFPGAHVVGVAPVHWAVAAGE